MHELETKTSMVFLLRCDLNHLSLANVDLEPAPSMIQQTVDWNIKYEETEWSGELIIFFVSEAEFDEGQ